MILLQRVNNYIAVAGTTSISYEIDTSGITAGSYYLLAAYDFGVDNDGNTNPEKPGYWEAKGWKGSTDTNPSASANVSDLSAGYDITLHGLGK